MNFQSLVLRTIAAPALLTACGDDDPGGSGSGTDTEGSTSSPSTSTGESMGTSGTTADSASAEGSSSSSSTGDESSSSGGPSEVMLGGNARDFLGAVPIAGAQISLYGDNSMNAVTDEMGAFELGPLPPDIDVAIVAAPSEEANGMPAYVGAIIPERTGLEDRSDVDLSQIQVDTLNSQIDLLEKAAEVPVVEQAIVIVLVNPFAGGSSLADGTITATMTPAPADNTFYAADELGAQVLNSTEIGYQLVPAAVFYNLPDADPGDISVTVEHAMPEKWACDVPAPVWPTLGAHTTLVLVECECLMDCG